MFEVRKPACTHINDFSEGEGRVTQCIFARFFALLSCSFYACISYFRKCRLFILVYRVATLNINIF